MKTVQILSLLALAFSGYTAYAGDINVDCDGSSDGSRMTCVATTTDSSCEGLAEIVPQVCQGFSAIEQDPAGCQSTGGGSSLTFTCRN